MRARALKPAVRGDVRKYSEKVYSVLPKKFYSISNGNNKT